MPAFVVEDGDPYEPGAVIVFAPSDIVARRKAASQLDHDEIGGLSCRRLKWADEYEEAKAVPATAMLAHGWQLTCCGCEQLIYDGGVVARYDENGEEYEEDVDPVGTQHSCYCTAACQKRDEDEQARRKRGERRFWNALAREAMCKLPGITIEPEKTEGVWSGHHHRYFGAHSKSGRDRALCFVVRFTFPGSKYGGSYRYDLGYEATKGERQILIANGDMAAWEAFRDNSTPTHTDKSEGAKP
ncbi:putative C2H2-type domain-containing protein [Hyphomicrobium sp. 1Nfss2.1]|uniref:hypothetical protein n=1 Tax=Hyphomicrobium sp. 1Nfss2.1 TaxID=3413936 RepID=UPI003C7B852A